MASIAGVTQTGTLEPRNPDEPIWQGQEVTEDTVDVLRVRPVLGRSFTRGDGTRRPVRVGLLAYGAWQRRFGGDTHIPGRMFEFRDGPVEIVGGYLGVAGTPIVRGRAFTLDEERGRARVAIVSASIASSMWPGQEALGQPVEAPDGSVFDVIGVAADIRRRRDATASPVILVPWGTLRLGTMSIVTRTPAGLDAVHQTVSAAVRPRMPHARITVSRVSDRALVTPRMVATIFGVFGAVALVVAGIGVFGIQAVVVAGRRREIAVRIALGGHRARVTRRVVGQALLLVAIGLGAGLIASAGAATWTAHVLRQSTLVPPLHRTTPYDASAWAAGVAILFAIAIVAAWLPARNASRRDPLTVLKTG